MFTNVKEASKYIVQNLQNLDPEETFDMFDERLIGERIKEELLDRSQDELEDGDLDILEDNIEDDEFLEKLLKEKCKDFQGLLKKSVEAVLEDYMTDLV